jgi:hypothetical protein
MRDGGPLCIIRFEDGMLYFMCGGVDARRGWIIFLCAHFDRSRGVLGGEKDICNLPAACIPSFSRF